MEKFYGLAVNDHLLMGEWLKSGSSVYQNEIKGLDGSAYLGHGHFSNGEALVAKGKRGAFGGKLLEALRARQAILYSTSNSSQEDFEYQAPLRFRGWMFAALGGESFDKALIQELQEALPHSAFKGRVGMRGDEALMMWVMDALARYNVRDVSDLTTRGIRQALAWVVRDLAEKSERLSFSVLLMSESHLFAFGLRQPLAYQAQLGFELGEGELHRSLPHFRALVVGNLEEGPIVKKVPEGHALEIGKDAKAVLFPLFPKGDEA